MTIFRIGILLGIWLWASSIWGQNDTPIAAKIKALQQEFCGQQKSEEISRKLQDLVAKRVAELSPESRAALPPIDEMVKAIKEQLWSTFHVEALCLERGVSTRQSVFGMIHGHFVSSFLVNYGFFPLIHETGSVAVASMLYNSPATELHVVKFEVFVQFSRDVFSGHGDLAGFVEVLNPNSTVNHAGMLVQSWTGYSTGGGLTSFSSAGSQVAMLFSGFVFTTLAQLSGILIGYHLKDRYPFLGYTLIVASAEAYLFEMISWITLSASISSGGSAGSELAKTAVLLGISPWVITGPLVGVSAAALLTYIGVSKYLQHLRELRTSAKSLLNEGVLAAIRGNEKSLLDELWESYPRKKEFDAIVVKMAKHMEKSSSQMLELKVKTYQEQIIAEKTGQSKKRSLAEYLPSRETFSNFWREFRHNRQVKAYKSELQSLHKYLGQHEALIDLSAQGIESRSEIARILQGKFLAEKTGWFSSTPTSLEQREKLVSDYLKNHELVPLHTLITANVKRIKFNDEVAHAGSKHRWKTVLSYQDFKELKDRQGYLFSAQHITHRYFMMDLQHELQSDIHDFTHALHDNNLEKMTKITKKLLKEVLFVSKKNRDIPAALKIIRPYAEAVDHQQREKLAKRWLLDVVDENSCAQEVDFVCHMAEFIHRDALPKGQVYSCPLAVPYSCPELISSQGLLRPATP